MNPRSTIALVLGGLAAVVALAIGLTRQMGVKSFGHPAGRVVRAGQNLCVLMETRDPFFPSLKGRDERDMSYSYALWMIPESCEGDTRVIGLDRGVASGNRTHNIGVQQYANGVVWLTIQDLKGVTLATGQPAPMPPPASVTNAPISQLMGSTEPPLEPFRAQNVLLDSGDRFVLATEEELKVEYRAGARIYDNSTAKGTYKPRKLCVVHSESGPIPKVANATAVGQTDFRNGAFMRASPNGPVVRFINPEGVLVVHEAGDPVHPRLHFSRLNLDGTVAWSVDTKLGRLTQVLAHDTIPAFIGELPGQLTEPWLAVVHLKDGIVKGRSLKSQ